MGNSVTQVLERKDELSIAGISEITIDQANDATVQLRPLLKQYGELRKAKYGSDYQRYKALYDFYCANYNGLMTGFGNLYSALRSMYTDSFVAAVRVAGMGEKLPHYQQFIGQLYIVATCLNDEFRQVEKNSDWKLNKYIDLSVVEPCQHLKDTHAADPAKPTAPQMPESEPEVIEFVPQAQKPSFAEVDKPEEPAKVADAVVRATPQCVKNWVNKRFAPLEERQNVAFDLVRASVNLVLGGLLIAVGTSLKLPLSTTYITFMVAMGSSLADRAWGRESAVYRVTGVISVIGGWFVTAGAAFILGALVAAIMYYGGIVAMYAMIALVIYLLIHSHIKYNKKKKEEQEDVTMQIVLRSDDEAEVWNALKVRTAKTLSSSLLFSADTYKRMFEAFAKDSLRPLKLSLIKIVEEKAKLKKQRRLETRGLQRIDQQLSFERSTWYHLCTNSCQQMLNTLTRIGEPMKEHADNSFSPLSKSYIEEFSPYCRDVYNVLMDINHMVESGCYDNADEVSARAKELKHSLATLRKTQTRRLQGNKGSLRMDFEYLNIIQESHELLSEVRNLLRGSNKYFAPVA
jgi:hypothetical protein